jgi:hypothetical protein
VQHPGAAYLSQLPLNRGENGQNKAAVYEEMVQGMYEWSLWRVSFDHITVCSHWGLFSP